MATNDKSIIENKNGNVWLIDPNMVNVNTEMTNAIPQYQDMYISAELTAKQRGRTVLETNNSGLYSFKRGNSNDDIAINFIGNNQDDNAQNPNYLNFTTNWYDNNNEHQTEGFGISSIKVVTNSSFIPQVNIQFIDLRGLAFFNQENSPYRMLFNFPPPIFFLTIKGYYGKPIQYMLHLVKYTSEFRAESGNFVIDAQFVAMTYAPLTDLLFTYIVNFRLIDNIVSVNPTPYQEPKNTAELILKLKSLYQPTGDGGENNSSGIAGVDTSVYDKTLKDIELVNQLINSLLDFKNDPLLTKAGPPILLIKKDAKPPFIDNDLTLTSSISDYNGFIITDPSTGIPQVSENRLMIGYLVTNDTPIGILQNEAAPPAGEFNYTPQLDFITSQTNVDRTDTAIKTLNAYRKQLLETATGRMPNLNLAESTIPDASKFDNSLNIVNNTSNVTNRYAYLDITDYYMTLYKKKTELKKTQVAVTNDLKTTINDKILRTLGMSPTIYNIFRIILGDVDYFFNKLRRTSFEAENEHHVNYKSQIVSGENFKDVNGNPNDDKKIYAFPLIINTQQICGQNKETRIAPIELSNSLKDPFPEIKLVQEFINTFPTQRNLTENYNMKSQQNENGTNKWIPMSPVDSTLGTPTITESPYIGIDTSNGGSEAQKIGLSEDPKVVDAMKIALKRFYILTQFSIPKMFYDKKQSQDFINFFSKSEALNLIVSLHNSNLISNLQSFAKRCEGNPDVFYNFVKTYIPGFYDFTEQQVEYINIRNGGILDKEIRESYIDDSGDVYVDKNNSFFKGLNIYDGSVVVQGAKTETTTDGTVDSNSQTPTEDFQANVAQTSWKKWRNGKKIGSLYAFTNENVFYIKDVNPEKTATFWNPEGTNDTDYIQRNGVGINSRYLTNDSFISVATNFNDLEVDIKTDYKDILVRYNTSSTPNAFGLRSAGFGNVYNRIDFIDKINTNDAGNAALIEPKKKFYEAKPLQTSEDLNNFTNITSVWAKALGDNDIRIFENIINYKSVSGQFNARLSALVLLSNFGYTLSPFNIYPSDLNKFAFSEPSALEVPLFIPYYMGALVGMNEENNLNYNNLYEFFVKGSGRYLSGSGILIFADIIDVNKRLSFQDKEELKTQFDNNFYRGADEGSTYNEVIAALYDLYTVIKDKPIPKGKKKSDLYYEALNTDNGAFQTILQPMLQRTNLINFSELTFKREGPYQPGYKSLIKTTQPSSPEKTINDSYFNQFFLTLKNGLNGKKADAVKQEESDKKLAGDVDIINETYYSFKNINDKWVVSPKNGNLNIGYPFNEDSNNLIDLFAFVDRAMNPIGNTIINPEMLTSVMDDPSTTVFSVITQLLSANNFEFFPLQNFMKFGKVNEWRESFLIDTNGTVTQKPAFVCMYFGGSSSYPTGIESNGGQFMDDGIIEIIAPSDGGGKDFSSDPCFPVPEDDAQENGIPEKNIQGNLVFPYRQVRAFRVRFGEQNQSMFTNIKIESKEYPETNESIQIMSRLAGDNKLQAPAPKGQNLYNVYENRSYSATVTGLGNAMIQPTQYFQLENVPLYNGAYLILSVEHQIDPNKMTTTFSGTKILKYPVPRVISPSAILGFDGGNTDSTDGNAASRKDVMKGPNGSIVEPQAQYNSMYDFKIK